MTKDDRSDASGPGCDCVDRINGKLERYFAKLDLLITGPRVPLIMLTVTPNRVLRDGSIKAMKPKTSFMLPRHCPFCGTNISYDDAAQGSVTGTAETSAAQAPGAKRVEPGPKDAPNEGVSPTLPNTRMGEDA